MKICRILATAVLMVGLCMPASAQDFDVLTFGEVDERVSGMEIMVFGPEQGDYVTITLATLLDGLVDFPDTYIRYSGLIEWVPGTPTLDAASFSNAIAGAPGSKVIRSPDTPPGATLVRDGSSQYR